MDSAAQPRSLDATGSDGRGGASGAAAGLYGATLPLAIAAFARSSVELAAGLRDAADAMERTEHAWVVELRGLEGATARMGSRIAGFAARRDELARYARSLPDGMAARCSLEDAASRLGRVVAELADDNDRMRARLCDARNALASRPSAADAGPGCVELATETVEHAQQALRIGDEIVDAGRQAVAALKTL